MKELIKLYTRLLKEENLYNSNYKTININNLIELYYISNNNTFYNYSYPNISRDIMNEFICKYTKTSINEYKGLFHNYLKYRGIENIYQQNIKKYKNKTELNYIPDFFINSFTFASSYEGEQFWLNYESDWCNLIVQSINKYSNQK